MVGVAHSAESIRIGRLTERLRLVLRVIFPPGVEWIMVRLLL